MNAKALPSSLLAWGAITHTLTLLIMETLTNEQILEGNKLIAEFMGESNEISDIYYLPQFGHYFNSYGSIEYNDVFRTNELKYRTSWDWLMPVVEKIESLDHVSVDITKGYCRIFKCYNSEDRYRHGNQLAFNSNTPKIQAVWLACVEFTKWYKEQK